jgi:aspartyl-tRNA(Asn)/glutamyl-tRNA(Gln) amidotransferase subunit A
MPLAPSLDHVGAMANCVRDLAILLQIIAGYDTRDRKSISAPKPDYVARLERPDRPRFDIFHGFFEERAAPPVRAMMEKVIEPHLKGQPAPLPAEFGDVLVRHRKVMAVEAAVYHSARLKRHPDDYPPAITSLLEEGLACPAAEYAACLEHKTRLTQAMEWNVEPATIRVSPATVDPAPAPNTTGDPAFNSPWSYTGLPTVSLPVAWTEEGLPLCVQLIGDRLGERPLLTAAAWVEKTSGFAPRPLPL